MSSDVLDRFGEATRAWFSSSFPAPTSAQVGAWEAISTGQHTLVVAPTGSGKTLSAFLWAIDSLVREPVPQEPLRRCRVVYVSPMKALAVDVERNLRSPLVGIAHAARRLDLPVPDVTVAVRSGDTSAADRRSFARRPSDILITTPESLYLMLTSQARESLRGVETVILDEIHAVAGTKRGAHLALSLERLDALLDRPATRVGLSATVRPVDEVARFLAGGRPVTVVQPPSTKRWDLEVVVPVRDLSDLSEPGRPSAQALDDLDGPGPVYDPTAAGTDPARAASIWPHVEERIVDLVAEHRSTLVFANSRRLAERLTARLNEIWAERLEAADAVAGAQDDGVEVGAPARLPAQVMAMAGSSHGAPPVLARAHHGSVSKEQRALIEDALKSGQLPAVVATSSLELGIDMGAVDLVVQVEAPPSVASGLQRVGRAGHQVGEVSHGVLFPKHRGDLVPSTVVVERMRAGAIESIHVPANPVDVLAQHLVAMAAMDEWRVEDIAALVHRAAPFATLPRSILEETLDLLAGRYPSDEFADLRPRIVWDRLTDTITGRPGAQRLAVISGGTIPDRGLFGVFLAGGDGPGRRVGELDEEMVYESRVGDVITLGSTSWRIEDITHDQVLVTPAPGQPGRLPFWKGDTLGRPLELGQAVGAFVRELGAAAPERAQERVRAAGLDPWAADNLLGYLREQRESTGVVPDDRTVLVERFRDEIGDWRLVLHSPFGNAVHAPWSLAITARMRERYGLDVQAMSADDGIVLRLPDPDLDGTGGDLGALDADLLELLVPDPDDLSALVREELSGSAVFAARFRECAARALLLPRRRPDRRQALWQQRQRASALLQVASRYPTFPIVLETMREVLQDVFDLPGLVEVLRGVRSRSVQVVQVQTQQPSPFARSLLFGYVAQHLYDGDSPLADRRAAALSVDPALLGELLGDGGAELRDLLDPEAITRTAAELQRLTPERAARGPEDVADLLRVLGPLAVEQVVRRSGDAGQSTVTDWLHELEQSRRVVAVTMAGEQRWSTVEDTGRLRDALGVAVPVGVAAAHLEPIDDPLGSLVVRYARTHGPFGAAELAAELGIGSAVASDALRRLVQRGQVVEGALLPEQLGGGRAVDFCDADVLRTLRRRSLAALRAEVEPVTARDLARFVPAWQGATGSAGGAGRGRDMLLRAVEQLSGARLPASAVESLVLPARIADYRPGLLDEVMASGEVVWQGSGSLPGNDGWVSLHLADTAHLTLELPSVLGPGDDPQHDQGLDLTPEQRELLDELGGGGAHFFRSLSDALGRTDDAALTSDLWALVWAGLVTNDTLAPLRARLGGGRTTHRGPARTPRPRYGRRGTLGSLGAGRATGPGTRAPAVLRGGPPEAAGRWSLLPAPETDPTVRAWTEAELLLDRHGVLTRGAVLAEGAPGGFATTYRVLSAAEEAGRVRRGYFVEGLGAAQFATTGAIDRLRAASRPLPTDDPDPRWPGAADDPWDTGEPSDAASSHRLTDPAGGRSMDRTGGQPRDRAADRLPTLVLAATDPANVYGAAVPWPERAEAGTHRPGRTAGALVVIVDGELVLYVERGGRTVLSWSTDPAVLDAAAGALARHVPVPLRSLTIERLDGAPVLGLDHPLVPALTRAGFHTTPKGLRKR
ncbi:ATP-dependent helicase [Arsenicicoccus piscis]|nr:ATP-dependent helicase [Arsenicicoccus piscis]MCH8628816.1 ATP-dependent helicase [Arsenicicoccus piscis]